MVKTQSVHQSLSEPMHTWPMSSSDESKSMHMLKWGFKWSNSVKVGAGKKQTDEQQR